MIQRRWWAGVGRLSCPRSRARAVGLAAALTLVAVPSVGQAQTGEELSIRRLALERAEAAQREGRHAEALELAERAGAIQMTPSVRFFVARELVAVGRRAEGLLAAQTCMREADQSTTANREAIRTNCRQIADGAQALAGNVVVRAPAGPAIAGLEVTVAGHALSALVLGLPYYVDPGSVTVTARAPGRAAFERTVTVGATQSVTVALELPVPAAVVAPVVVAPVAVVPEPVRPPPMIDPPRARPQPSIAGPAVLWGVGGAALVASGVLLYLRESAINACPADPIRTTVGICETAEAVNAANGAGGLEIGSAVLLGVGVAAIGGGLGWWAASRGSRSERAMVLVPTRGGVAVAFGGSL